MSSFSVKEVSLFHSEGILAVKMKHDPLALVDEEIPIVVIATRDRMHGKMTSVIEQLRARGARLIVVCNEDDDGTTFNVCSKGGASGGVDTVNTHSSTCTHVRVPQVVDALQTIVNVVPLQLLLYHLTALRGYDVDQQRNLAKSETVT